MKAVIIAVLALCAVASAASSHKVTEGVKYAMQGYNRYLKGEVQPKHIDLTMAFTSQGLPPVGQTCKAALINLILAVNNSACTSTYKQAPTILFDNTTQATQSQVAGFCTSTCITNLNTTIYDYLNTCTPLELIEVELYSAAQGKPFVIWELLIITRLPCDTQDDSGNYCVVSWSTLLNNLAQGKTTPTAQECNLCLAKFIASLIAYTPLSIRDFYFVDQFCTMDGTVFCWAELQAINAMADTPQRTTRICSTNCYQKVLIKQFLYEATNGTIDTNAVKELVYLDDLCGVAPGGDYCFNEFKNVGPAVQNALASGCAPGACPSSCYAVANQLAAQEGCCLTNFLQISWVSGNASAIILFTDVIEFINNTCDIYVPPACPRDPHNVTVEIVVSNLEWAAYQLAVDVVHDAIRRDIAIVFGVYEAAVAWKAAHQLQSSGFALMSPTTPGQVSFTYTVSPSTSTNGANGVTAFNTGVQQGTLTTPNLQSLDNSLRSNPNQPMVVASSSSAMNAGMRVSFSVATLLFAAVLAFVASRV